MKQLGFQSDRKSKPPRQAANGQPGELLDKEPPCDRDAERMLLRAIVLDQSLPSVADLRAEHFYDGLNREIFVAVATLRENGQPIDIRHLDAQLRESDLLEKIGGRAALAEMLAGEPLPALTRQYLRAVQDAYAKRQLVHVASRLLRGVHSDAPTAHVLKDAHERLDDIGINKRSTQPQSAGKLIAAHPKLHEPLIDGVLRRGETMNVIAPPKAGKSWLAYGVALSVVTGGNWLERFACHPGRVLIVDNELHPATLAHRLRTVAGAMALQSDHYGDSLTIWSLRGNVLDLNSITKRLRRFEAGAFDLIILDAFYRALPSGQSENDNAAVSGLYNLIDDVTKRLNCSWVGVHHNSKGSQAEKTVTDVGAGAGAQSRAADCHLILRQHEQDGAVVLEAAVRSFAPVEPLALRWVFPLWQADDSLDPGRLKGRLTKGEQRQIERDEEGKAAIVDVLGEGTKTARAIRDRTGLGQARCDRLLGILENEGAIGSEDSSRQGGRQRRYHLNGDS